MQIPTIVGAGLSGLAHASGDVDGIFYGSAETYAARRVGRFAWGRGTLDGMFGWAWLGRWKTVA